MLYTRLYTDKFRWLVSIDMTKKIEEEKKDLITLKNKYGSEGLLVGTMLYIP